MVVKDPLTTINVKTSTRDALYHLKGPAKTYDQIILELLDIAENKPQHFSINKNKGGNNG
jgi:hypothetical protein